MYFRYFEDALNYIEKMWIEHPYTEFIINKNIERICLMPGLYFVDSMCNTLYNNIIIVYNIGEKIL